MISEKLKRIIFNELYHQLGKVEIIPYNGSIFFIHRENKYWYFEYENGRLWWRYDFFNDFFELFSLGVEDYTKIISEWVEEVLNCKVSTIYKYSLIDNELVEEVLNCKVLTTSMFEIEDDNSVEEVLNCKVLTTVRCMPLITRQVEEVLSHTNK